MMQAAVENFDTLTKTYRCPNCGPFTLDRHGQGLVNRIAQDVPDQLAVLSHTIRKMNERSECPLVTKELIKQIVDNSRLPSPTEQVENLLLWLGDNLHSFGDQVQLFPQSHTAIIGAAGLDNFYHVTQELINRGFFKGSAGSGARFYGTLTLDGWQAYEELRRGRSASRKAFMAMAYGDGQLDHAFRNCFKPAVAATGFRLQRLDEAPPAGLIDNRLRVEIHTSRFLIADLTGENQGAYWEAGYAEGLGKPVIYTCEKSYFEKHKTQFDTSHHYTVVWDTTSLESAAAALMTTIRATLPAEAVMEDPESTMSS
jgi:hypothetical protein